MSVKNKLAHLFVIVSTLLSVNSCAYQPSKPNNYLVGQVSKEVLFKSEPSFEKGFSSTLLSLQDKNLINNWPKNLHIDIYFGTWCHDSQREVPKILSVLQQNTDLSYKLIGLDINKTDPQQLAKKYDVKYTPTFIVYIGEKEIGRIIERPEHSLVSDINKLIQ